MRERSIDILTSITTKETQHMIQGTKVQIPSTTVVKIEIDLPTATLIADALG